MIYLPKLLRLILKIDAFLRFPATRMLASIFHEFCRSLDWFCLLCHIMRHKNINYAKLSHSQLQLPVYTAYKSLQKITNPIVRHLTRPYFLESCGDVTPEGNAFLKICSKFLWRCYTTKEASRFRSKVVKTILAKTNVETVNIFIDYAISFKHLL